MNDRFGVRLAGFVLVVALVAACGAGESPATNLDDSASQENTQVTGPWRRLSAGWSVTGSTVWMGGGLLDRPGERTPDRMLVEVDEDGQVLRRLELPVRDDEFLDVRSIEATGDQVRVFGIRCGFPTSDDPGCSLAGRMPVVVSFDAAGKPSILEVPGLLPAEASADQVGLNHLGLVGDQAIVARFSNVQIVDDLRPVVRVELVAVDLGSGAITSLGEPMGAVGSPESLCMAGDRVYAVVVSEEPEGPLFDAPRLRAARLPDEARLDGARLDGAMAWEDVGTIELASALEQGPPSTPLSALCGSGDGLVLSGTHPAGVTALFVMPTPDGIRTTEAFMRLRAWHAQPVDNTLLVTELGPGLAGAWEVDVSSGTWKQLGTIARPDGEVPYIVRVGERLVNLGPALATATPDRERIEMPEVPTS